MDSTDRERISVTREELYKMLAHEVSKILALDMCGWDISITFVLWSYEDTISNF